MDLENKMKYAATALLKSGTGISTGTRTGKPNVVRVEFDPPLLDYEEVKPRLLGIKSEADEALGAVRPKIPYQYPIPPSHSLPFPKFLRPLTLPYLSQKLFIQT